jgi:prophage regulatory protein
MERIMGQHESNLLHERRSGIRPATDVRFIRLKEVLAICGKSRSSMYEAIKKGEFPAPVKLRGRSSAWIKSEVLQWMQSCIEASRSK